MQLCLKHNRSPRWKVFQKEETLTLKIHVPFFFFLYEAPVWSTETSTKHEAVSNRMWLHCRSTRPRQSLVWKSRGSIAVSGCLSEDECRHTVRPVAYVTLGGAEGCCPYRYSTVHHYTCCSWWNWWSPGEPCLLDVSTSSLCWASSSQTKTDVMISGRLEYVKKKLQFHQAGPEVNILAPPVV